MQSLANQYDIETITCLTENTLLSKNYDNFRAEHARCAELMKAERDRTICCWCSEKQCDSILVPCGHTGCETCLKDLLGGLRECPDCDEPVRPGEQGIRKFYLSDYKLRECARSMPVEWDTTSYVILKLKQLSGAGWTNRSYWATELLDTLELFRIGLAVLKILLPLTYFLGLLLSQVNSHIRLELRRRGDDIIYLIMSFTRDEKLGGLDTTLSFVGPALGIALVALRP